MEGKKFQIRTDKKIDSSKDIRWSLEGAGYIKFSMNMIAADQCNGSYRIKGTEGFLQKAGVLTFLKTTTQLQIWFDDVLEVTWVYEDNSDGGRCAMRNKIAGLMFKTPSNNEDTVSTDYRYGLGKCNC